MELDILCIGSARFDVFISGKLLKPNKLSIEETITLENDKTYNVEHAIYEAGGSAINSSILFARQGLKSACLARTGKDHLANQIKIIAKHENVNTDYFVSKPEHHTDMKIHVVTERKHEINLNYQNSNISIRAKEVKFPKLHTKNIYFAELPDDFKIYKYYVNWAKISKTNLIVNIKDFKNYKKRQINFVLSSADKIFIPSTIASEYFDGNKDKLEIVRLLNSFGASSVVLYDVNDEAYAFEDSTIYIAKAYKKITPLDMTGSNDVFSAGYVAAILQDKSVPEALTLASANACSVMSIFGTRIGILQKPALRTMKVQTRIL